METEERLDDMLTLKLYLSAGFRMKHRIIGFWWRNAETQRSIRIRMHFNCSCLLHLEY